MLHRYSTNRNRRHDWTAYLDRSEKVLWEGRPAPGIRFSGKDAAMIPFSIIWCALVAFGEFAVITQGAWWFEIAWSAPFVLVGFHMLVGRFFVDAFQRKHTWYAITEKRALIATDYWGQQIRSLPIGRFTQVDYRPGKESTFVFARETRDNGETSFIFEHGFELIPNGDAVYRLVQRIQRGES